MPQVVTAGETMLMLTPTEPGRLRHASHLSLRVGGAESNVAIGLARLGIEAGWISLLSDDEPGDLVLSRIRAEGVDTSAVGRIAAPTGLYLREQVAGTTRAYYYRRGSAASRLAPGVVDPSYLDGARVLHISGITPALSESSRAFTEWIMEEARGRGLVVSFDLNYRAKLWPPAEARECFEALAAGVDMLLLGDEEAQALWESADEPLLRRLAELGPREVVLKRGAEGSRALVNGQPVEHRAFSVAAVDTVGAGDAFSAGYIAGWLWQREPLERLRIANAAGALCAMTYGDYEGLPTRSELEAFLAGASELGR